MRNPDAIIAVYIMANRRNGAIYIGVTSDLHARVWKHKLGAFKGFTDDYGCKGLVRFEPQLGMTEAIARKADQEVAARMEAGADRRRRSGLGRLGGGLVWLSFLSVIPGRAANPGSRRRRRPRLVLSSPRVLNGLGSGFGCAAPE